MRHWSLGKLIIAFSVAIAVLTMFGCGLLVRDLAQVLSDPEGPVIGDPAPASKRVFLHNATVA